MMRSLSAADIKKGARVIVRADLDIAGSRSRHGTAISGEDMFRLRSVVPAIRYLLNKGVRLRIIGHRGRPKGRRVSDLSLAPIVPSLSRLLRHKLALVEDPFSEQAWARYADSPEVLVFENLRFWPGEEDNSRAFARSLKRWGDIYINEAFANSHRAHASVVALAKMLPSYAGLNLVREVRALERILRNPRRPLVAVFGGVKIETKLPLIRRFLRDADRVLVGGALANTIFALMGERVGKSTADIESVPTLSFLKNKKLYLPSDLIIADKFAANAISSTQPIGSVKTNEYIVDVGPSSQKLFASLLKDAKTIIWNGPLGFAEVDKFANGTKSIAKAIQKLDRAFSVVGGGDTIAALSRYNLLKGFSHVSTGGGAMLEFLAGKKLPALEALKIKEPKLWRK